MRSVPAYEQLYQKIRREILSGGYAYGQKIPGKRVLAEQNDVSVITAAHALEMLHDEGYIQLRPRSGAYAAYRPGEGFFQSPEAVRARAPISDAAFEPGNDAEPETGNVAPTRGVPSSADVAGFPLSVLRRTMRRVIAEQDQRLMVKSPNAGIPALREALSLYLERSRDLAARPEQIIIGAGAEYLYGLIAEVLGAERVWAIENPSYEKIEQVYSARKIQLERLPLGRDGIRPEALRACDASVLHVSPYRSYPSDVTASASRRAEYLAWAEREDHYIVEDDYESEFSLLRKATPTLFSQNGGKNVIYVNTFSRTVSPAMRVGYMVLPEGLLPRFQQKAGFYSCTVPTFDQYVLADLISSGDFERHINRVRRKLRKQPGDADYSNV